MLNRRNALKLSLGTAVLASIPFNGRASDHLFSLEAKNDGKHLSLSKHGNFKGDRLILWSVLSVLDKASALKSINGIFEKYNYKTELKYSSGDKFKVSPSMAIIDLISEIKGVEFNMIYFDSNPEKYADMNPSKFSDIISSFYSKLSISKESSEEMLMKCESRFGPSDKHIEKCGLSLGKNMKTINAKEDRLLQVNNLISGVVYSFLHANSTKNENKAKINKHFDEKYKLSGQIKNEVVKLPSITVQRVKL